MHQDVTWHGGRPQPKKWAGLPLQFSANFYCGQTAAWIKMPLGTQVGLSPDDIVLDGDPARPSPKRGQSSPPQFSAYVYCGQTAGCIKMSIGMEVGLSPGDFVLDGGPDPLPKKGGAPDFWPTSIVAKLLHGSRCHLVRRPTRCVRWGASSSSPKGHSPTNFRPMFVVAKLLDGLRCYLVWR